MGHRFVQLTKFCDWTIEKRKAGKDFVYSTNHNTILCNQLYVHCDRKKYQTSEFKSTIKVCCCECSSRESSMLSTWYQYSGHKCYKCSRLIKDIYNIS